MSKVSTFVALLCVNVPRNNAIWMECEVSLVALVGFMVGVVVNGSYT